jgi:hypothetical protein
MLLTLVVKKGLGHQHVHQAAQAARQDDLARGIAFAFYRSTSAGQAPYLFPLQRDA